MSFLPLQLPPQAIDEFQALWKETYGTDLPRDLATVRAHQLIALLQMMTDGTVTEEQLSAAMSTRGHVQHVGMSKARESQSRH